MLKTSFRFFVPALLLAGSVLPAQAQQCFVTKDQVLADLAAGLSTDEIERKYANCVAAPPDDVDLKREGPLMGSAAAIAFPSETIKNTGSTYWEAIKSCGYHPQREEADCAVEIRRPTGFGGPICQARGSHEYLLFCVDFGAGLVPVHTNGVHVHDERLGALPNWSFAASIQSNPRLLSQANAGQTLLGRVILSWQLPPTNCNYRPIWGNQSDFRFRLDP